MITSLNNAHHKLMIVYFFRYNISYIDHFDPESQKKLNLIAVLIIRHGKTNE